MKITLYTISDCYFSKQEKEYLQGHGLPFEERNLEENRDFLTEMLTISNNFAGTPVTKIEKDDGQIIVLKGFTIEEFDKTFGFAPATDGAVTASAPVVAPAVPVAPVVPAVAPVAPAVAPPAPVAVAPVAPAVDMQAIAAQIEQLKKLQQQLAAQTAVAPAPVVAPAVPVAPVVPAVAPVAPVAVAPVAPPAPSNVDDSLAAILAELQTKINASQNSGGTGTQTT